MTVSAPGLPARPPGAVPPTAVSQDRIADVLCCPSCRGTLQVVSERKWKCADCRNAFPVVDGIPFFLAADAPRSQLEDIDYDAVHSINPQSIASIAAAWHNLVDNLGMNGENAVEIGAGTGALTLGLLARKTFRSIVATDISLKFLRHLWRAASDREGLAVMACDANNLNLRDGLFGVVLGRSILHHLVDYQATLKSALRILRPGGVAVFYEPLLQGKVFIALFADLLLQAEQRSGENILDAAERNKIATLVRHITKEKWYPQDRQSLLKLEDKYIFDLDRLIAQAGELGFASVAFHNGAESVDVSYWKYFVHHLAMLGIKPAKLAGFRWIGESFGRTYGLLFGDRMVAPMGFFVFRK